MLNVRLLLAGLCFTLMSAYVVANMDKEAEATSYGVWIFGPDDGTIYYEGDPIEVSVSFSVPGDECDYVDITTELQCTLTERVEDTSTLPFMIGPGLAYDNLTGPTVADPDVAQPFCIIASGDIYSDRVGVTFIPMCMP